MKKLITIILLAVALLPQANYAQQQGTKGAFVPCVFENPKTGERETIFTTSTALIIANYDYTNGKKNLNGWKDLDSVKTEYRRLADSLFRLGFDTIIRLNLTNVQMKTTIEWFIDNYGYERKARILVYYSGHGNITMEGGKERGYTVPVNAPLFQPNADFDKLEDYTKYERNSKIDYKLVEAYKKKQDDFTKKAISYEQWLLWAQDLNTKHALFLFDCCFAGQILYAGKSDQISVEIEKAVANKAVEFITASDRYQTAPGESTFLKYFLLAVSGKAPGADANGDDYLKSSELFDYLSVNVLRAIGDNPRRGDLLQVEFDKQGEFVFWLPKNQPASPQYLQASYPVEDHKILAFCYGLFDILENVNRQINVNAQINSRTEKENAIKSDFFGYPATIGDRLEISNGGFVKTYWNVEDKENKEFKFLERFTIRFVTNDITYQMISEAYGENKKGHYSIGIWANDEKISFIHNLKDGEGEKLNTDNNEEQLSIMFDQLTAYLAPLGCTVEVQEQIKKHTGRLQIHQYVCLRADKEKFIANVKFEK